MTGLLRRHNVVVRGPEGARPLVFAHGFGCDQAMWRHVAPAFEDRFRTVLFDHVGFGGSDLAAYRPEERGTLEPFARDVVAICEELELEDVVVVGHSVSAVVGVLAARMAPGRISALVLVGPSPRYLDDEGYRGGFSREDIEGLLEAMEANYLGWSGQMAPLIAGGEAEHGAELTASFCRTDPEIASHFARTLFLADNRADLAEVAQPALVLQCADDPIAPREVGEHVARAMPGGELVVLDVSGHCPHLTAPAETIAAIERFLEARAPARA
jgi:sigma-B regulation protein RsbQ